MWIVHCVRPFKTNRPVGRFYYASMLVRCFSSDNSHRVLPRYVKSFAPSVRPFMPFLGLVWSRNLLAAMDNVVVFPFGKITIRRSLAVLTVRCFAFANVNVVPTGIFKERNDMLSRCFCMFLIAAFSSDLKEFLIGTSTALPLII